MFAGLEGPCLVQKRVKSSCRLMLILHRGIGRLLNMRSSGFCDVCFFRTSVAMHFDNNVLVQEEIDGYLMPMRAADWDKGSLLSMRTMNFASSFPYESINVPVDIIIGEDDTFLLKTAKRVSSPLGIILHSALRLPLSSVKPKPSRVFASSFL